MAKRHPTVVQQPAPVGFPVGVTALRFTIFGNPPRTKKNHGRIVPAGTNPHTGKPMSKMLPSKEWEAWRDGCGFRLPDGRNVLQCPLWIGGPANMEAHFFSDARHQSDAVGLYQGLADLLQFHGCFHDDRVIVSWNRTVTHDPETWQLVVDKAYPRVDVCLTMASLEPRT